MAVDNSNTDIQFSDSQLKNLSPSQQSLLKALTENPCGLMSGELTRITGISNKAWLVNEKLKKFLDAQNLEIFNQRISNQWLWRLQYKPTISLGREER